VNPHPSTELALVRAAQAGDKRAFRALVDRCHPLCRAVAARATGDAELARDLAQDALLTAWQQLPGLRDPERFRPWLCGIVRNTARYARRHRLRHAPDATHRAEAVDPVFDLPLPAPSVLDELVERERRRDVADALDRIPAAYRDPLVLFYREGHPVEDIATALGISEQAVRQRLCRGRKQLGKRVRAARSSAAAAVLAAIVIAEREAAAATGAGWLGAGAFGPAMGAAVAAAAAIAIAVSAPGGPLPLATPSVAETSRAAEVERTVRVALEAPRVEGVVIEIADEVPAVDEAESRRARRSRPRGRVRAGSPTVARANARPLERPALSLADIPMAPPPPRKLVIDAPKLDLIGDLDDF
jgi:RNA polymerase sigma factor (sigma-70 family)